MENNLRETATSAARKVPEEPLAVGLFVTCLVDTFRPSVAMATVQLLEQNGCSIVVPATQTCCGQPGYNSGDENTARELAKSIVSAFANVQYVVIPSGSCAGMITSHYPALFEDGTEWRHKCEELASRCYELTTFLTDVLGVNTNFAPLQGTATYHDSCSGLRELGIKTQPRKLLQQVPELALQEMEESEVCCGFGGTFCVKYPEISEKMVGDKLDSIAATKADWVLGGDLGCLLNIAGKLKRMGRHEKVYHVAEVLAGVTGTTAAIGHGDGQHVSSGLPKKGAG